MSLLNELKQRVEKSQKRIGRGYGSGKGGHTSTRGQKGYLSRTGSKVPLWFEGGNLPLVKRVPMLRGKGRLKVVNPTAQITLTDLENMQANVVTLDTLKLEKMIDSRFKKAKIIATGTLNRKVTIQGLKVSKNAQSLIEKAGGSVE